MDLMAFLRARLAEERALAARIKERLGARGWPTARVAKVMRDYEDPDVAAQGDLIEMFSPDRVLAEVEAKLRIIELHQPDGQYYPSCVCCAGEKVNIELSEGSVDSREDVDHPCPTLRLLALRYADHPDYREEWRP